MKMISIDKFSLVIEYAPLIALDFIIKNSKGEVLLGRRVNEPAKGYWFVPGGRVFKNEMIEEAQQRILMEELDIMDYDFLNFKGVFEHFYSNSFIAHNISTHYVVLAYELIKEVDCLTVPKNQHLEYDYFELNKIIQSKEVHQNTKNYFI